MYPKYHEMDLMHSADEIRRLRRLSAYRNKLGLKNKREQAGLSQRDLAEISGVPVRTIQQYEQRQKDIRKAAYDTVCRLADALHCAPDGGNSLFSHCGEHVLVVYRFRFPASKNCCAARRQVTQQLSLIRDTILNLTQAEYMQSRSS